MSPPQSRAQRSSQLFTDGAWLVHLRSSPNVPAHRVTRDFAVSRRLSGSVRIPRSACPFTRRWRAEPRAPTKRIHKDCGVSLTFPDSHRVCVVPARGYVSMSSGGAQPSRGEGDGRPCPPLQPASPAVSPCAETRPPVTIRTRGAHTPPQPGPARTWGAPASLLTVSYYLAYCFNTQEERLSQDSVSQTETVCTDAARHTRTMFVTGILSPVQASAAASGVL